MAEQRYRETVTAYKEEFYRHTRAGDVQPMVDNALGWTILLSDFSRGSEVANDQSDALLAKSGFPRTVHAGEDSTYVDVQNVFPRLDYSRRSALDEDVGRFHWGQYKLLLSELEFLSWARRVFDFDSATATTWSTIQHVVYAGSASGLHIVLLSKLFPKLQFHCWDPAKFSDELKGYAKAHPARVQLFNALFTEDEALKYADKVTLFISDVRRFAGKTHGLPTATADNDAMATIKDEDHQLQMMWVRAMKPLATMLKFAPPYVDPQITDLRDGDPRVQYEYFNGLVCTQAYAPAKSTESRLIFAGVTPMVTYDRKRYESQYVYLNAIWRRRDFGNHDADSVASRHDIRLADGRVEHIKIRPADMLTSTALDSYDQWRSTQILLEWILTEVSARNWQALDTTARLKFVSTRLPSPFAPTESDFAIFHQELIAPESQKALLAAMNKVVAAFIKLTGKSFAVQMLTSLMRHDAA